MSTAKPLRVVFKSIEPGDILKLDARSNLTPTGGGARDFRFPYTPFQPAMTKVFPNIVQETRRRNNRSQLVPIRTATLVWIDANGHTQQLQIKYEPPTSARPSEGRIPQVHRIPPLDPRNLPPSTEGERFALFIEESGHTLRIHYVSHWALLNSSPPWHPLLRNTIVEALKNRRADKSALGWVDFTTGQSYAHE